MTKVCRVCKKELDVSEFYKHKAYSDGLRTECKSCKKAETRGWIANNKEKHHEYNKKWKASDSGKESRLRYKRKRRQVHKKASPSWIDIAEVDYIYTLARNKGLVVDHIIPLNSEFVCGLHVQDNLRCIPEKLNRIKGNRYWPDSWDMDKDLDDQSFMDLVHFELVEN